MKHYKGAVVRVTPTYGVSVAPGPPTSDVTEVVITMTTHMTTPAAIAAALSDLTLVLSLLRYATMPPATSAAPSMPSISLMMNSHSIALPSFLQRPLIGGLLSFTYYRRRKVTFCSSEDSMKHYKAPLSEAL